MSSTTLIKVKILMEANSQFCLNIKTDYRDKYYFPVFDVIYVDVLHGNFSNFNYLLTFYVNFKTLLFQCFLYSRLLTVEKV